MKVKFKGGSPHACQLSKAHCARGSYLGLGVLSWQEMRWEALSSILEPGVDTREMKQGTHAPFSSP